jgi:hypothetical protein
MNTQSSNAHSVPMRLWTDQSPVATNSIVTGSPASDSEHQGSVLLGSDPAIKETIRACFGDDASLSEQFLQNARNLLDEAVAKMTTELREENAQLVQENLNLWCDRILTEVSQGLTIEQKETLACLAEGIAIDPNDDDLLGSFDSKLRTLKAMHCRPSYRFPCYEDMQFEVLMEADPAMQDYLTTMEKLNPKR